jgi:hypothetical protein
MDLAHPPTAPLDIVCPRLDLAHTPLAPLDLTLPLLDLSHRLLALSDLAHPHQILHATEMRRRILFAPSCHRIVLTSRQRFLILFDSS